jgi:pyridoxamine 5'-phosphate oxidase
LKRAERENNHRSNAIFMHDTDIPGNPLTIFNQWFEEELQRSTAVVPAACCLSTVGADLFPNARFVALKGLIDGQFVVTGPVHARKGTEISQNNRVALTFWWSATQRQVRVQGTATLLDAAVADQLFAARNRDSQIVSTVSAQGQELLDPETLHRQYQETDASYAGQALPRPAHWSGYAITPLRIELLAFQTTRFHERTLYQWIGGQWVASRLQP